MVFRVLFKCWLLALFTGCWFLGRKKPETIVRRQAQLTNKIGNRAIIISEAETECYLISSDRRGLEGYMGNSIEKV